MRRLSIASLLFIGIWVGFRASSAAPVPAEASQFVPQIRPLLTTYCIQCHNDDTQEGGVNYARIRNDADALNQRNLWKRARARIISGEMPPDDAKPLRPADKERLIGWMKFASEYIDCDPTRRQISAAPPRRLTRAEYDLTIQQLFGLKFDSGLLVGMAADGGGEQFDNLAADLRISPTLMDQYFAAADKVIEKIFQPGWEGDRAKKALFIVKPGPKLSEADAARQIITRLARRAYRKPAHPDDVSRLLGFYERSRAKGESFENGIRAVLKPVLVSPQFLFRIEESGPKLNDHELAVRLSYFLWSSMPDEELFKLADAGQLSSQLDAQVVRMLNDPKGQALTDQFAVQWLQLRKLANARPTTEFFPSFQPRLKQAMYDEVTMFFDELRQHDGRILDLLDADYTFVNEPLAKHYGINGVKGDKLQRVSLEPGHHRGGLMGMGAILALTSHTFRTSPTQRGKYVLEVIFGTPPPPPPANVGMIKDDEPKTKMPLTFREQLAQHATQPSCAGCHRKIDPLGFALDHYNAIGAWRESTKEQPLDVSGMLPTGEKINGITDLKQVFLRRKDDFTRNVIEKMLIYALGRELEPIDECTVREILTTAQQNDYRFHAIVKAITHSHPFRERKN